jgi:hypothetical protein
VLEVEVNDLRVVDGFIRNSLWLFYLYD